MKTLIVFAHSNFKNSRVNKALLEEAEILPNVTIRNLDQIYGSDFSKIDVPTEQKYLKENVRVVFQCPTYWFNVPPMLKAYMDAVFTHGWAYGTGEHALAGKVFQLVVSTGSSFDKYQKSGVAIEELFKPILHSAAFLGMIVAQPLVTYGCMGMSAENLQIAVDSYRNLIEK